jgi:serine/threonine-protein kinase RsbW
VTRAPDSVCLTVRVPAELGSLRLLSDITRQCLIRCAGLSPGDCAEIQILLAVREACSNVVRHAYAGRPAGVLRMRLDVSATEAAIEIEDEGNPLEADPGLALEPLTSTRIEDLREGSYGLPLIRETMDSVIYGTSTGGTNVVRLYKKLRKSA